uniref:Retrotransposon Copia-like N-terminal domain-containing protein n=1 Tax=Cannabis sativa TaxID=3483 RepID=A0A803PEA6_CANSA
MVRTRATGSRHSHRTPPPHPSSSVPDALSIEMPIVPPATNHPRKPLLQNHPPVHRPAHEDNSNLYYLSSGDHPGLILVTPPLSDHNFQPWRRDFELSVGARNKTAFLKGTLPSPPEIDPLHNHWTRCNQMVMSWILHSVTSVIKSSIMFLDTAAEMWTELHSRFDQGNGPRIFEL